MPGWLIVICGVCLAIPLARLAALLFTAGLCLVQPAKVRRAISAWKGGKSHRASDRMLALPPGLLFGGVTSDWGLACSGAGGGAQRADEEGRREIAQQVQ